jgi:hypothetical protein
MSAVTLRTAQAPLRRLASRSSSSPSFTRISIPSIAARTKLLHPQLLRPTVAGAAQFSTKPVLMSSAPPPSGPREYDPEIKDMASYIHNYKIDSDLAVHSHVISIISSVLTYSVRHCPLRLPGHPGLRPRGSPLQRMHQAPRAYRRRYNCSQWHASARDALRTRSRERCIQHRRYDPLVGLQ